MEEVSASARTPLRGGTRRKRRGERRTAPARELCVIASRRRSFEDAPAVRFAGYPRRSVLSRIGSLRVVGIATVLVACGGRLDGTRRTAGPSIVGTEDAAPSDDDPSDDATGISSPDASDSGGDATGIGAAGDVSAFLINAAHTSSIADPSL